MNALTVVMGGPSQWSGPDSRDLPRTGVLKPPGPALPGVGLMERRSCSRVNLTHGALIEVIKWPTWSSAVIWSVGSLGLPLLGLASIEPSTPRSLSSQEGPPGTGSAQWYLIGEEFFQAFFSVRGIFVSGTFGLKQWEPRQREGILTEGYLFYDELHEFFVKKLKSNSSSAAVVLPVMFPLFSLLPVRLWAVAISQSFVALSR